MRSVNEVQTVTDAIMSVVERQWPDQELPQTLTGEIRTAIQATLAIQSRGTVSPRELADRWGISPDKVLNWIRKGDLCAINVASDRSMRPKYRISDEAIEAFQRQRQPVPQSPIPHQRRRPRETDVIEFF